MKRLLANVLTLGGAVLLLAACSPRVMTEVTMSYPARSVDEVRVFDVGDTVPNSSVAIGKVAVVDGGFATNCGYDRMLQLAKERTAETGGNGLLLTEHREPSFWGSSCHQLMGTMLSMSDMTVEPSLPNPVMEGIQRDAEELARRMEEMRPPKNSFRLNVGPSWILSEITVPKGTYKHLSGLEANVEYLHTWRNGVGVGVNGAFYRSSYEDGVFRDKSDFTILYIGPSLSGVTKLGKRWLLNAEIGLGYAHTDDGYNTSNGIGMQYKLGVDYMLSKQVGLGLELNSLLTNMKKPDGFELPDDKRYGFDRLGVLAGVRFYL
ncbi:MAG: hypothetical protein IJ527_10300 [Prevotella sp.]|nr:hypothetical protein [Prevotella sp.]